MQDLEHDKEQTIDIFYVFNFTFLGPNFIW